MKQAVSGMVGGYFDLSDNVGPEQDTEWKCGIRGGDSTVSVWDGVNFLRGSLSGVVCLCVSNTNILAVAEQSLYRVKSFSPVPAPTKTSRLGVGKRLGGDTAGTTDPNCPRGYSIPRDVFLSNKSSGNGGGRGQVHD